SLIVRRRGACHFSSCKGAKMTQAPSIRWFVTSNPNLMVEHASQAIYAEGQGRPRARAAAAAGRTGSGKLQAGPARRAGRLAADPGQRLAELPVLCLLDGQGPALPRERPQGRPGPAAAQAPRAAR